CFHYAEVQPTLRKRSLRSVVQTGGELQVFSACDEGVERSESRKFTGKQVCYKNDFFFVSGLFLSSVCCNFDLWSKLGYIKTMPTKRSFCPIWNNEESE
ncbi:MAG: hypothetical protein KBS65_04400, partial [Prevotella sp.]|nr:hypothetical protein [Candidatus Equicola stercoris]